MATGISSSFAPNLKGLRNNNGEDADILVQVPAATEPSGGPSDTAALLERVKDYLSDPRYRIRLDDLVASEIRAAAYNVREDEFLSKPPRPLPMTSRSDFESTKAQSLG